MPNSIDAATEALRALSWFDRDTRMDTMRGSELGGVLRDLLSGHVPDPDPYTVLVISEMTPLQISTMAMLGLLMKNRYAKVEITHRKDFFRVCVGLPTNIDSLEPDRGIWGHGADAMLPRALAKAIINVLLNEEHYDKDTP